MLAKPGVDDAERDRVDLLRDGFVEWPGGEIGRMGKREQYSQRDPRCADVGSPDPQP